MRFSALEIRQIGIAILALTAAFALVLANGVAGLLGLSPLGLAAVVGGSFLAVVTGFVFHELAHKALAQRYGCWAEFRYYPFGLLLALITAFVGFLLAAPGAVYISGHVTAEQNGRISLAGPMTNAAVGAAGLAGTALLLPVATSLPVALLVVILSIVAFVNLLLGAFNMIPFPPLDGSKVFAWNVGYGVAALAVILGLLALGVTNGLFFLGL
jgi:Zn-dependent protease